MAPSAKGTLAFVTPRYGADVVGGSEAVMREAALGLAARGWDVHVLTTCARDHFTWRNEHPAGMTHTDGITLHRFEVEPGTAGKARAEIEGRIVRGETTTLAEQETWLDGVLHVPGLLDHLRAHARDYDAIVLSPYLFWTTARGAAVAPERTIVMPCLHDESYARLELFRPVLTDPALLWFLSGPEHELAHVLTGEGACEQARARHVLTGAGVAVPERYDAAGFRDRHGIERPYVLYAGRREGGKGWDDLLRAYAWAIDTYGIPVDLLTFGVGAVDAPAEIADRVIDLGFLDERETPDAFAGALAYVQPSTNESFSRTVMESWLAGTPVIANAASAVLAWHCERSGGGLLYADDYELAQCLAFVAAAPETGTALASRGRAYVLEHYRWETVIEKMEASIEEMMCASS